MQFKKFVVVIAIFSLGQSCEAMLGRWLLPLASRGSSLRAFSAHSITSAEAQLARENVEEAEKLLADAEEDCKRIAYANMVLYVRIYMSDVRKIVNPKFVRDEDIAVVAGKTGFSFEAVKDVFLMVAQHNYDNEG